MHRRRLLLVLFLALTAAPGAVSAAAWHSFSSKTLGFAIRYPVGWKALSIVQLGGPQIQFSYAGTPPYTVNVMILNVNGGTSAVVLQRRFLAFEKRVGNVAMATMRWSPVILAGRHGIGGVYIPATEGGVSVSNGTYVIPWKSRTYVVSLLSKRKPVARTLARFPAVYQQMLSTWHFL